MEVLENEPMQVSLPLPRSIDTKVFVHLTVRAKAITIFLTTANQDDPSIPASLGSFVYALPDVSTIRFSVLGCELIRTSASTQHNPYRPRCLPTRPRLSSPHASPSSWLASPTCLSMWATHVPLQTAPRGARLKKRWMYFSELQLW
jgi:hypothetical protein